MAQYPTTLSVAAFDDAYTKGEVDAKVAEKVTASSVEAMVAAMLAAALDPVLAELKETKAELQELQADANQTKAELEIAKRQCDTVVGDLSEFKKATTETLDEHSALLEVRARKLAAMDKKNNLAGNSKVPGDADDTISGSNPNGENAGDDGGSRSPGTSAAIGVPTLLVAGVVIALLVVRHKQGHAGPWVRDGPADLDVAYEETELDSPGNTAPPDPDRQRAGTVVLVGRNQQQYIVPFEVGEEADQRGGASSENVSDDGVADYVAPDPDRPGDYELHLIPGARDHARQAALQLQPEPPEPPPVYEDVDDDENTAAAPQPRPPQLRLDADNYVCDDSVNRPQDGVYAAAPFAAAASAAPTEVDSTMLYGASSGDAANSHVLTSDRC